MHDLFFFKSIDISPSPNYTQDINNNKEILCLYTDIQQTILKDSNIFTEYKNIEFHYYDKKKRKYIPVLIDPQFMAYDIFLPHEIINMQQFFEANILCFKVLNVKIDTILKAEQTYIKAHSINSPYYLLLSIEKKQSIEKSISIQIVKN